jgi:hypothetical protein
VGSATPPATLPEISPPQYLPPSPPARKPQAALQQDVEELRRQLELAEKQLQQMSAEGEQPKP